MRVPETDGSFSRTVQNQKLKLRLDMQKLLHRGHMGHLKRTMSKRSIQHTDVAQAQGCATLI